MKNTKFLVAFLAICMVLTLFVACDLGDTSSLSNMTIGQQNALKKAESYLKYSSFSRKGLIDQLEFEGFDTNDILFAVDNVEVDWNEQCYKKAETYLKYSSFSKQRLIEQLEYEGFTDDQIAYAINKVGY